jgi:uncharacterized protein YpuA (DUF1002 family)
MAKSKLDKIVEDLRESLSEAKLKLEKMSDSDQAEGLIDAINDLLASDYLKSEADYEDYASSYYDSGC